MNILGKYIVIFFLFFLNINSSFAFDFAPEIGDPAPVFHLEGFNKYDTSKTIWDLNDFEGKWIVLYFYPRDFTAGCTLEAKGFSDLKRNFQNIMQKLLVLVLIIRKLMKVSVVKNL